MVKICLVLLNMCLPVKLILQNVCYKVSDVRHISSDMVFWSSIKILLAPHDRWLYSLKTDSAMKNRSYPEAAPYLILLPQLPPGFIHPLNRNGLVKQPPTELVDCVSKWQEHDLKDISCKIPLITACNVPTLSIAAVSRKLISAS